MRTIGILGGMGPAATAAFFARLVELTPASKDQDHPRVIILSDPSVPDRTEQMLKGEDRVSDHLRANIAKLIEWGADVIGIPCNTAHYFFSAERSAVPFVSIIDAEIAAAMAQLQGRGARAWLTCTVGTRQSQLYQEAAQRAGLELLVPPDEYFDQFTTIIAMVKDGHIDEAGRQARETYSALFAIEDVPALTACTELPLAYTASGLDPARQISSIDALAVKILEVAGYPARIR